MILSSLFAALYMDIITMWDTITRHSESVGVNCLMMIWLDIRHVALGRSRQTVS